MSFGTTPVSSSTLASTTNVPIAAVQEPGQTNLTATEGGPGSVDGNGNRTAPVSIYVKDGGDVTLGTSTDANTVASVMGRLTKIRDLLNTTLAVTQSGAWNITNISGTISLPTGAATSAKQPALGTAGTASSDVLTVQGIASMTALKVDGSGVTQPVSGTITANAGTGNFQTQLVDVSGVNIAGVDSSNRLKVTLQGSGVTQAVSQSGTWTVQPGNTANTTAWKVDGSAVTQPVSLTSTTVTGTVAVTESGTWNMRTQDGAGNALTSNSSTYTAKFGLDSNLLGTLGTAFSTAGKVDVKAADGDVFVRQATAANLNATVTATNLQTNLNQIAGSNISTAASGVQLVGNADGAGNALTSNSTTYTAKKALDSNILGTLGTAFTTAGKVDVKAAAGDVADLAHGQATMANSVPVTIANNQGAIGSVVAQAVAGTALAADQTNSELRVSNYGKNSTAGDTAMAVGTGGQVLTQIVDSAGTNVAGVDSSHRLSVIAAISGTWTVGWNSNDSTAVASAAYTTTQTQADQTNTSGKGVRVVLNMTNAGTGSVTLEIDAKDVASTTYTALLTGAAVTSNSTNVYVVYPGLTPSANAIASDVIPRTWRVKVVANNANSATYSVGVSYLF